MLRAEGVSPATTHWGTLHTPGPGSLLCAPRAPEAHASVACAPLRLQTPKMENSLLGTPRICQADKHLEPLV